MPTYYEVGTVPTQLPRSLLPVLSTPSTCNVLGEVPSSPFLLNASIGNRDSAGIQFPIRNKGAAGRKT